MFRDSNLILIKNKNFPWQTIDGETIVINSESKTSFELNRIGSLVWNALDGKTTIGQIQQLICDEFEVPQETVEEDLFQLFEEMQKSQLIESL